MREKVEFVSGEHKLSGLLESPESDVKFYALFAYSLIRLLLYLWQRHCHRITY